ncbi:hypothetical protein C8J56DRAFT_904444 [Mycena floridula]|nr:hypothetical protein C8J56DRAFT_904444 [Mycena floridula]
MGWRVTCGTRPLLPVWVLRCGSPEFPSHQQTSHSRGLVTVELVWPSDASEDRRAGFLHEHKSRVANIPWDTQKIYDDWSVYGKSSSWVDAKFLKVYDDPAIVTSLQYDNKSVMHYGVKAYWLTDASRAVFPAPTELSAEDKRFAAQIYPAYS